MGFFSAITGGGGKSSSTSGYGAMPQWAQESLYGINWASDYYLSPNRPGNLERFTPMGETADETAGYNMMRQGFAPTQQTLNADLSMLQNPFNDFVINEINRQGNGQNSILRQTLDNAGQFGSNRSILGANDIDLSRMNTIGSFLQNQHNINQNHALTTLPTLRQNDAANLVAIGDAQRALDYSIKQAPATALQTQAGLLQGFGATVNGSTQTQSGGGGGFGSILGGLGSAASGVSALGSLGFFSDRRLKENIKPLGQENGHNVYEYNYKGSDKRYIGVMADEVAAIDPDAVGVDKGFFVVDYDRIGVQFREAE